MPRNHPTLMPLAEALTASGAPRREPPMGSLGRGARALPDPRSGRPESVETYAGAVGSGFNEGLARVLGGPVDLIAELIRLIPGADEVMPKTPLAARPASKPCSTHSAVNIEGDQSVA